LSQQVIAGQLGRHKSSMSRELRRNRRSTDGIRVCGAIGASQQMKKQMRKQMKKQKLAKPSSRKSLNRQYLECLKNSLKK
jgi:IS30 family transposase